MIRLKIHSLVDIITNSSSEIFCTVKGEKEFIESVIKEILSELGCDAVELCVYESEDEDGNEIKGQYDVIYDYEIHHSPCKFMQQMIKEKLT
jgi:hypothetical protein